MRKGEIEMKNIIKIKCTVDSTFRKNNRQKTIIATAENGKEYTAKLYRPTEEYFAEDEKGREFLVGQVRNDDEVDLMDGFELIQ